LKLGTWPRQGYTGRWVERKQVEDWELRPQGEAFALEIRPGRHLGGRRSVGLGTGWIEAVEEIEKNEEYEEVEEAGFWAGGASGEPSRSGDYGLGEMTGEEVATVGDGIEEGFAEVEAGVHAYGEPQGAGALEGEAPEKAGQDDAGDADPGLSFVGDVDAAKGEREQDGGGPEAHALGEGELRVTAKRKFFREPYQTEKESPEKSPAEEFGSMNGQGPKMIGAAGGHPTNYSTDLRESEAGPDPKKISEGTTKRQTVISERTFLQAGHHQRPRRAR